MPLLHYRFVRGVKPAAQQQASRTEGKWFSCCIPLFEDLVQDETRVRDFTRPGPCSKPIARKQDLEAA
jgi:hypothetical protein